MFNARRFAGAVLVAGMGVTAMPLAAGASEVDEPASTEVEAGSSLDERIDRLCSRVPDVTDRVERALGRLNGEADVRGSILWLEARAEGARDNGRDDRADLIEGRIAVRTERLDVLEARLDWLSDAADQCDER